MGSAPDTVWAEWRRVYEASEAPFFLGPMWAAVLEEYTAGEIVPAPLLVELASGRRAVIAATTEPTKVPGVRRTSLGAWGTVGGWLSDDDLDEDDARELTRLVLERRSLDWRRGPHDPLAQSIPVPGSRTEMTHVVSLDDDLDVVWKRWRKEARRVARKAERAGGRVERTDDWRGYWQLYEKTLAHWGPDTLVRYDRGLFDVLARTPGVELWGCSVGGALRAGTVIFRNGCHAASWHAARDVDGPEGTMHLLDREITRRLAESGARTYDLGGSGPRPGVVFYKESVGGSRQTVAAVDRRHPAERLGKRVRQLLVPTPGK